MRLRILALAAALAACGGESPSPTGPENPGGPLPFLGGCNIFPPDNAWNRDVSLDPVHPGSGALIAAMVPSNALHLDLGTTQEYYGIPYTVVPENQPLVPITYGTDGVDYSDESDPGPMPIPHNAPIEGGSTAEPDPSSGDHHLLVLRQGDCMLYELYNTERTTTGFRVSSSAIWDLKVNHSGPAGWTSADAGGLPILPGLLKYEEIASGEIRHALRFTVPQVRRAYVTPASHCGPPRRSGPSTLRHQSAPQGQLFTRAVLRGCARAPDGAQALRPDPRRPG